MSQINRAAILSNFFQKRLHQRMLFIALPMILSNITTPLMGLVDTAVLGHMNGVHFLAGASIATLIITQIYWVCGFLRMTTTGLSAQAKGADDAALVSKSLVQSLCISALLALVLLIFRQPILMLGIWLSEANESVQQVITSYFEVRIWGAPAAVANLALIGWLIGQQKAKNVLLIQVSANLINVALNFYFVYGLNMQVTGVALATVVAEYFIFVSGFIFALKYIAPIKLEKRWFSWTQLRPSFSLNANSFIRNLILQACIAFLIFKGIDFGTQAAAINAIIMQFFTLIALGLDGVAYAAEALVGEKKGQKNSTGLISVTLHGLLWSSIFAILYSFVFFIFGPQITALITNQPSLQVAMLDYQLIIILLPLIAHWCFFFDGVFVGLTRAKAMRNSMLTSGLCVYFPAFTLLSEWQNEGLWLAMLLFLLARGVILGGYFIYLCQKRRVAV